MKKKCCIKCKQFLLYSSFCKNQKCELFIDDLGVEEILWNEWVMTYIDQEYKIMIKQIYPSDL